MKTGKKGIMIIMVLVLIFVGACDKEPSVNRLKESSSENSSSGSSEESFPTPEDTENLGSALITYSNVLEHPQTETIAKVSIPVTIERDPENPGKYIVNGFTSATVSTKTQGIDRGNLCWAICTFQPVYYAIGNLIQDYTKGCTIKIKISSDFPTASPAATGTCSAEALSKYKCPSEAATAFFWDNYTYELTKEDPSDIAPKETDDDGRVREAKITKASMPGSMEGFCKWGD